MNTKCHISLLSLIAVSSIIVNMPAIFQDIDTQLSPMYLPRLNGEVWVYNVVQYDDNKNIINEYEKKISFKNVDYNIQGIINNKVLLTTLVHDFEIIIYEKIEGLFIDSTGKIRHPLLICPRNPQIGQAWSSSFDSYIEVTAIDTLIFHEKKYAVVEVTEKSIASPISSVYKWAIGLGLLEYRRVRLFQDDREPITTIRYYLREINSSIS